MGEVSRYDRRREISSVDREMWIMADGCHSNIFPVFYHAQQERKCSSAKYDIWFFTGYSSQKVSKPVAITSIDTMTSPFTIKKVDGWEEEEAINVFKAQPSKNTSYVDCTNMVLMKWGNLDAIFSFDEVYRKSGFLSVEDFLASVPPSEKVEDEQEEAA
jgi:hypothetical protein